MKYRRTLVPLVLLLLSLSYLTACKPKQDFSTQRPPLLRINGSSVTLDDFRRNFEKTLTPEQALTPEERVDLERSYLIQVIDRQLALAEARRLGIKVTPQETEEALAEHRRDYPADAFEEMLRERGITLDQWRSELAEGLLMEKVARQQAYTNINVTEKEIEDYYEGYREEFDRPDQVRARQIVVGSESDGKAVLERLRRKEPFAEVARQVSLSPDSEQGGDLGFFARGEMPPEFETIVFTLPVGRISDLVRSEYGYHIFLVEERRAAVHLKLNQVREEVRAKVRARKEEEAYQAWLQMLRGQAAIEVNWSLL